MSRKEIKVVSFGEPETLKIKTKPKKIIKDKPVPPKGKRPIIKMVNFEKKPLTKRQKKVSKAIREKKVKVDKIIPLLKNIGKILLKKN